MQALASFRVRSVRASLRDPGDDEGRPSLVVGAGHRTHLAILAAARRHHCPSVVLMKPTIPTAFFDLCLIPEHDLARSGPDNVIPTKGMLNRLPARRSPKDEQGLLLIGGPSKHHGWDPSPLAKAVSSLVNARPAGFWKLTDSRRTPPGFLELISDLDLEIHPCSTTAPDWLPAELGRAREVWVTEDSMSMIYEALTARARVGLLAMPRKGSRSRVVRGIDQLIQDGWTRFFADGDGADLPEAPAELHEASRCATEVLRRFFPNLA